MNGEVAPRRDPELVDAARAGDVEAFAELVRRHQDRAYRTALRVLRDPTDAQDAAQDAFVAAYRALPGFRGDAAFSTWLYRIVVNASYAVARRRGQAEPTDPTDLLLTDRSPGPDDVALGDGLRSALTDALQRLPVDLRVVFVLRELEQLSVEETADVLDISHSLVTTRLHRARRRLADLLGSWERSVADDVGRDQEGRP